MRNEKSRHREGLFGVHTAIALAVMVIVVALSMGDLMEIMPVFAAAVSSPVFPFFHEIHDIIALSVGLFAAYKYSTRLGIVVIFLFMTAHIPYAFVTFSEEGPELVRIFIVAITAIFGIGLISRLHKEEEKVCEEVEGWRSTFDSVSDPLSVHSIDFKILKVNKAYAQFFKMSPEDIIGKSCYQLVHGTDKPCPACPFVEVMATKEAATEEFFDPYLGVHVRISASPLFDEKGDITGCVHVLNDVTERKRVEERLLHLASFPELNPSLILEIDMQGTPVYLNPASKEQFPSLAETGYQHPFLAGILEMRHSGERPESSYRREVSVSQRYYQQIIHKVKTAMVAGDRLRIYGYDVTDRKQAEEKLQESEEKFRTLVDEAPVGITISTASGTVLEINKALLQMHGYESKEKFTKTPISDRYYNLLDRQRWQELIQKRGKVEGFEVQLKRKDGTSFWACFNSLPQANETGEQQFITVVQDITERKQAEEALRKSEERFRNLVENLPVGIAITSRNGHFSLANAALQRMRGYDSKEELMQAPVSERYYDPKDRERWWTIMQEKGMVENYEIRLKRKDGSLFWGSFNSITQTIESGENQIINVIQDVTERKRAEEALVQSEERFRQLSEAAFEGIVISEAGKILDANETLAAMLRCGPSEMIGKSVLDFIAHEYQDLARQNATSGYEQPYELTCVRKDGSTFQAEAHGRMVKYHERAVRITAVRDITERKRMEEDLKLRAQLLDAATDLIHVTDLDGKLLYVNETSCLSLGYNREELLGHHVSEFNTADSFQRPHPSDLGTSEGVGAIKEVIHVRKDGTLLPVEVHYQLINWGGKKVFLDIVRDITERKKMQEQLIAQDRLASIGQLVSGVAHEINNPLTGVLGFSDLLLRRDDLPADIRTDLNVVHREAMRTAGIVKNLLTFARKQPEGKEPVEINEQIQRVIDLRAHEQKISNIRVVTRFASSLPKIVGNSSQLHQVFFNIVINAEFFMLKAHQRGELTIITERIGDFVRASFADDGPGISKGDIDRIFNPFFTTKEVGKGTGLGLSICHGIITEHGGRIYTESESGNGATFIVELPVSGVGMNQEAEK